MNYKKITSLFLGALLLFLGGAALAQESISDDSTMILLSENREQRMENREKRMADNLCEKLSERKQNILDRIEKSEKTNNEKLQERELQTTQKRKQDVAKLEQFRKERDVYREEHYAKLEERAANEEQKQAVAKFKETVEKAVEIRRAAYDEAMQSFREGVDALKNSNKSEREKIKDGFRASVVAAFDGMESLCKAGSVAGIAEAMKNKLKDIKDTYREDRSEKNETAKGDAMKALVDKKNEALKSAQNKFQNSLDEALIDLRLIFQESEK